MEVINYCESTWRLSDSFHPTIIITITIICDDQYNAVIIQFNIVTTLRVSCSETQNNQVIWLSCSARKQMATLYKWVHSTLESPLVSYYETVIVKC